jgi:ubiquinone/menaquinone biosynthesis C-methylase UbiE
VAETEAGTILEVAAGTGALTRAMAERLSPDARIVATDLNRAMLDHAQTRICDKRITWEEADAQKLRFGDKSFDAVVCQFGAMFFPDKELAYREAFRVLKPGGHYIFSVWDRISENEFADVVVQTVAEIFPMDPPQFVARTPHGYYDVERIRRELRTAGFSNVSIEARDGRSKAPSAREAAVGYCQGTPLRTEIETRDASGLESATQRAAEALARRFGAGPIEGRIRAYVITAVR